MSIAIVMGLGLYAASSAESPPSSLERDSASQVVVVHDDQATEAFKPDQAAVRNMVRKGVTSLMHVSSEAAGWGSLISREDVVGIKVYASPGPIAGSSPAVVGALIESLLTTDLPASQIIVWDKQLSDLQAAGFMAMADRYGVKVQAAAEVGYDEEQYYESPLLGRLIWGDLKFGGESDDTARRSYVTKLMTSKLTKVINVAPLLNNGAVEVVGTLRGLALGSVDNAVRFKGKPSRLATAVPELYAKRAIGDKVVLNVVDALVGQYEGGERPLLHYAETLNELRFSRDPVALDTFSVRTIRALRRRHGMPKRKRHRQLYENAALLELGASSLADILVETIEMRE